ncbi:hypothetical protein [Lacticaseibacillus porcinae]|uniref:hypothetical protein n=1 Tax=Lacticaseibacillus porcinae TaxID=1123687 RepID=UPI000F78A37A|nr:hypothetical protein [Lacticaseibacillus porcinae]
MRRDLDTAMVENLATFREEPEYAALSTLYSVQIIDMTLSAFVLVVTSTTEQPPIAWHDVKLILAALVLQLPNNSQKSTTFMIISAYLRWLLPTRVDLDEGLTQVIQDQRLRLPHLGLVIPQLQRDHLNAWHQSRLQLCWETFGQIRAPLTIASVDPMFARRVDVALVAKMYLEGRQTVQHFTPEVLQHVLLGGMIFDAEFLPTEYPAVLNYLTQLFAVLPIPQAAQLLAVIPKVRPYVLNAVHDKKWFSTNKRQWLVKQSRMRQARHLLTVREEAEKRGIKIVGTAKRWRLQLESVESFDHVDKIADQHWHANNAGRARKALLPTVKAMPDSQFPGRINLPAAMAGALLLGDLMYAKHLQSLRYWQPDALEDVLLTITHPLHQHTKGDFCQFTRQLLEALEDTWSSDHDHALIAVVDHLLTQL